MSPRKPGLAGLLPLVCLLGCGCGVTRLVDSTPDGRALLIRSPQPDRDSLVDLHATFGVRTVLNLRGRADGEAWFEEERRGVEEIGAHWVHLPVSGRSAPSDAELEAFYALVEDPDAWPILMHCQGGIHRTGLMAAVYRIVYQGWSGERAVAELEELGFDWTIEDRSAVKRFLLELGEAKPARAQPSAESEPGP